MSSLSRIYNQDYDRNVTAVDLDKRFLIVGKTDGSLSAVYIKNGLKVSLYRMKRSLQYVVRSMMKMTMRCSMLAIPKETYMS